MSTSIRPALSYKNKYWIDRHRYYELKHFCLQYPSWRKAYIALDGLSGHLYEQSPAAHTNTISDPTARCAEAKLFYSERMELLKKVAHETDSHRVFFHMLPPANSALRYVASKSPRCYFTTFLPLLLFQRIALGILSGMEENC